MLWLLRDLKQIWWISIQDKLSTRDCVVTQCIPGRDMVEEWHTEYYGWHKYTPALWGGGLSVYGSNLYWHKVNKMFA